jgi:hypothetical protein
MSVLEVQLMATSRHLCRVTGMIEVGAGLVNAIAAIQRIGFIGQRAKRLHPTTLVLGRGRRKCIPENLPGTLQANSANGTQLDCLEEAQLLV